MTAIDFETPAAFRAWLEQHHATADALLVGFYKKAVGRPCMSWPESVDEALCFGWIDGVRRTVDTERYTIRFTPRKPRSVWSNVNIAKVRALLAQGRMRPVGLAAFEMRKETRSGIYSHEQENAELPMAYLTILQANAGAWAFYQEQPASYRKAANWWVASAKQEKTRLARLEKLVTCSTNAERVPQFTWKQSKG